MFCLPLTEKITSEDFGAKAAGLSQINDCGIRVPNGFAISKMALLKFQRSGKLDEDFLTEFEACLSILKSAFVIVRSSALGEDSASHSFAGQLDSFVAEKNIRCVLDHLKLCWQSLQNDRVLAYQKLTGFGLTEMGVIIQEFVEPDYAGVLFTQSPYRPELSYLEFVKGRGEKLVSGLETPESIEFKIGNEKENGYPFDLSALAQSADILSRKLSSPLDIEWVSKDGLIYLVQARPITVKSHEKVHWTNTNLNENYPDPISPLLYSIARDSYYHYFKNIAGLLQLDKSAIRELEYDFSNTVGIWGNRIYYNMTSIHNIMSASPLKSYFIDAFNKFVGYEDADVATADRSKTTSLLKLIWRLIRLNFGLEKNVREIENMVKSFSDKVSLMEVPKTLFYEFLDLRFNQWYRASLADFFAMIHYKLLGNFTRRFYGEKSLTIQNRLVQAIPNLMSTNPLVEIYEIAQEVQRVDQGQKKFTRLSPKEMYDEIQNDSLWESVKLKIDTYLKQWGFRCSGELMFFSKNYVEEPWQLIELLQSYMTQKAVDPRVVIVQKARDRKVAMRQFRKKIISKRHVLFPLWLIELVWLQLITFLCKHAISCRERVRYRQAEMYFRFKQVIKVIGGSDLYFLKYKEIGELLSSSDMFADNLAEVIDKRKLAFESNHKDFPEHFTTIFGQRPDSVPMKVRDDEVSNVFQGLAASGGQIQGQVKILENVLESDKLKQGDILVTKQTDPGWAMVFPLIGGLIVERGGALSHGAIVAREFGIPAVVGVANITQKLKDGDEVVLDGNTGKVYLK